MPEEDKRALVIQGTDIFSQIIWTPMSQEFPHGSENFITRNIFRLRGEKSNNAAHNVLDNKVYGPRVRVKMQVSSMGYVYRPKN
jgi:hypothetical protein